MIDETDDKRTEEEKVKCIKVYEPLIMPNNFCGNCGDHVSGNFCGGCGEAVEIVKSDRHEDENVRRNATWALGEVAEIVKSDWQMMDRDTGVNENLVQNNRTHFIPSPELLSHRNFGLWLQLILLIPGIGQVIYTLEVMKGFKNYLWPRLEEDSTLDLDSKKVKARSRYFYATIVSLPLLAIAGHLLLQFATYLAFLAITGSDDGVNVSELSTVLYVYLFILFLILPILIVLTVLIAPAFYIYHKHIILSQFIDLRYGQNTHHSGYPSINPSIFRVRRKPLVFFCIACASVISYVIAFFIWFSTFTFPATFIAVVVGILLWLISVVVWLVYEKKWHDTMYNLIRFEYENSIKRNYSELLQF